MTTSEDTIYVPRLANGAEIIACKPYWPPNMYGHCKVILWQYPNGEYATHILNMQTGGLSNGNYFDPEDFAGAFANFNARGIQEGFERE